MAIDVQPPRASQRARLVPPAVRSFGYRWRSGFANQWELHRRGDLANIFRLRFSLPRLGLARRGDDAGVIRGVADWPLLIIPGAVQYRHGEQRRGLVLMAVYMLIFAFLLVYAGRPLGGMAQGLLFAWHLLATVDAMQHDFDGLAARVFWTVAIGFSLGVLVYWPATRMITRVALPIAINQSTMDFHTGDVLWVNQIATPGVGDYVLYETNGMRVGGTGGYGNPIYAIQGQRLGRVVAIEGQTVAWADGHLTVDGAASVHQPHHGIPIPPTRLAAGTVFVLPDNLGVPTGLLDAEQFVALSSVSRSRVQGKVYMRTHPFSRFTLL